MVDVREMLCAQALAVVAQAAARLPSGQALDILYDAQDVKQDLLMWAKERSFQVDELAADRLRLSRYRSS